MKNGLLIIDGSAMLSTAYFGTLPPELKYNKDHANHYIYYGKILHDDHGRYTNAIFSFMNRLEKILQNQKPSHLAITFDITRNTFRKKLYPAYKENRKPTPEPLAKQKELLPKILMEIGIPCFASMDYEGDDLIGSLCEKFRKQIPVYILGNDHDLMQLVKPGIQFWLTCQSQAKAEMMFLDYTQGAAGASLQSFHLPDSVISLGREGVKWNMGVYPEQIPDLKALSGDASDNIPGVKGISTKTAALLLTKYGTLKSLFEEIDRKDTAKLKAEWKQEFGFKISPVNKLNALDAEANALLSQKLATIVTSLDFPVTLEDLRLHLDPISKEKWYKDLNFKSLLKKHNTV